MADYKWCSNYPLPRTHDLSHGRPVNGQTSVTVQPDVPWSDTPTAPVYAPHVKVCRASYQSCWADIAVANFMFSFKMYWKCWILSYINDSVSFIRLLTMFYGFTFRSDTLYYCSMLAVRSGQIFTVKWWSFTTDTQCYLNKYFYNMHQWRHFSQSLGV